MDDPGRTAVGRARRDNGGESMRKSKVAIALAAVVATTTLTGGLAAAQSPSAGAAASGEAVNMLLLPKFMGILPFDLANKGANEAAAELGNPTALTFTGPTSSNSVAGQIEQMTNAPTQGFNVVMLSNNAGDQIAPAAE